MGGVPAAGPLKPAKIVEMLPHIRAFLIGFRPVTVLFIDLLKDDLCRIPRSIESLNLYGIPTGRYLNLVASRVRVLKAEPLYQ